MRVDLFNKNTILFKSGKIRISIYNFVWLTSLGVTDKDKCEIMAQIDCNSSAFMQC